MKKSALMDALRRRVKTSFIYALLSANQDFPIGMNQNPTINYQDSFINAGGDTDKIWK